jgi:trk system potassium uptake protein TrkA
MKQQVMVIGLGRFGSNVARTLYQLGHDVMAIDRDGELVQPMMGEVTYALRGDATQEAVLREMGVQNFDIAIVAIGSNVEASIMVSVLLKTLNVPYIAARAQSFLHGNTLERIGCDRVIHLEEEGGRRLAHSLFNPEVQEYLEVAGAFGISRIAVPDRFKSMTLSEAGFAGARDKYGVSVIALRRGEEIILRPDPNETMKLGDALVLAGPDELVRRITD